MNIICVKQGTKYSADYVNKLYNMVKRNVAIPFDFFCYTDDPTDIDANINIVKIESDLIGWWPKLEVLNYFDKGNNILFDLDIVILNPLDRLLSVKTRTLSVLYSQWKEGYLQPRSTEKFPTLYNSSIMKWSCDQGKEVYDYFINNKDMILFKYTGIDRYLFNEPVQVDLLPTSIAYSYWKGVRYLKDTTPEKLRSDYEVCILNHNPKPHEIDSWIKDYWY
jgi:hypothetical protein